jgi:hypothetical protein
MINNIKEKQQQKYKKNSNFINKIITNIMSFV